mmetsp:Transcript_136505/g.345653  ORF Transcript_136505/g.345653 Transcript_136505/m.345653 type:complete len:202 (+) Transcript_136505:110-715(+)
MTPHQKKRWPNHEILQLLKPKREANQTKMKSHPCAPRLLSTLPKPIDRTRSSQENPTRDSQPMLLMQPTTNLEMLALFALPSETKKRQRAWHNTNSNSTRSLSVVSVQCVLDDLLHVGVSFQHHQPPVLLQHAALVPHPKHVLPHRPMRNTHLNHPLHLPRQLEVVRLEPLRLHISGHHRTQSLDHCAWKDLLGEMVGVRR